MAHEDIFRNADALLVDLSDGEACKEVLELCDQAAWIDPNALLVTTDCLPGRWEDMAVEQFIQHPEAMTIAVRSRRSAGGKVWATCPTTATHARATARAAKSGTRGDDNTCAIEVHGARNFDTVRVMRETMAKLAGLNLTEVEQGAQIGAGQWASLMEGAFGDAQGNITAVLENEQQVDLLKEELGNNKFKMGWSTYSITVKDDNTLAEETKNASRRAAMRRAAAPAQRKDA